VSKEERGFEALWAHYMATAPDRPKERRPAVSSKHEDERRVCSVKGCDNWMRYHQRGPEPRLTVRVDGKWICLGHYHVGKEASGDQ